MKHVTGGTAVGTPKARKRKRILDWSDKTPTVPVYVAAGLIRRGWKATQELMEKGDIKAWKTGKSWRTSMFNLKAFMSGTAPGEPRA